MTTPADETPQPDETSGPLGPNDPTEPQDASEITKVRKIPDLDDKKGQIKALTGALASALITATDNPIHMLTEVLDPLAKQLHALGVRQTAHVDPEAIHAPTWITDGATQMAQPVPEQPSPQTADPVVVRTAEAPEIPSKFKAGMRAQEIAPADVPVFDL